jgi:hypothetical protein
VASIDWEWQGGARRGVDILSKLTRHFPDVARVVFTNHAYCLNQAMRLGADYAFLKEPDGDLTEYSEKMARAGLLGLIRKISRRLNELTSEVAPEFDIKSFEMVEAKTLYDARMKACELRIDGREDHRLLELLERRGTWKTLDFDLPAYTRAPWQAKLACLCKIVELGIEDVSQLLECDTSVVRAALDGQPADERISVLLALLLSALSFPLRLARYDATSMWYYAQVPRLYQKSLFRPPWDELGLVPYLRRGAEAELRQAVFAIRAR